MRVRPNIVAVIVGAACFAAAAAGQPARQLTATVRLVEPGAEPRQELRYTPRPLQRSELTSAMVSATIADGRKLPTQVLPVVTFPLEVAAAAAGDGESGEIRCTMKVGRASASARGQRAPEMDKVDEALAALHGAELTGRFTRRGICTAVGFKLTDAARAAASGAELHQMIAKTIVALPEEAAGLGAVWSVELASGAAAAPRVYTATYTLRERRGDLLILDVALAETAPPGEMDPPAPGATARLEGVSGAGYGVAVVSLDRLLPVAASTAHSVTSKSVLSGPERSVRTEHRAEHSTMVRDAGADPR